jgi:hypothetical protein
MSPYLIVSPNVLKMYGRENLVMLYCRVSDCTEAEFLDVFLFAVNSTKGFFPPPPPPPSKSCLKLVCNVNIVYGNLKSENSQDYAQKPQRNSRFMNLAFGEYPTVLYSMWLYCIESIRLYCRVSSCGESYCTVEYPVL